MEKSTARFFVPDPAVLHATAEAVVTRREVRVERFPSSTGLVPILVIAFQLVAEPDLLRSDKAERGEVYFQIAHARGQAQAVSRLVSLSVGDDLLDVNWRLNLIEVKSARINDAETVERHEPYFSVG